MNALNIILHPRNENELVFQAAQTVDRGHRVTVADSHEPILPTYHWLKVLQDQRRQWQLKQVDVTPQLWKQHLTRQVTSQTVSELFVFTDIWMAILLKCKDPS